MTQKRLGTNQFLYFQLMSPASASLAASNGLEPLIKKNAMRNHHSNFASNLSSVPEESAIETSASIEPVIKVEAVARPSVTELLVPLSDEPDAAMERHLKRHSNAFRRKSSISARISKLRKYSFSRSASASKPQEDMDDNEVVLRKNL